MAGEAVVKASPDWHQTPLDDPAIYKRVAPGSGPKERNPGYICVDRAPRCNPDIQHDLCVLPWPFEDDSIHEVLCSHLLEHFHPDFIIPFFTELYRVTADKAVIHIFGPHWNHEDAYSDPTHRWRMTRGFFHYVSKKGRAMLGVEHYGFPCDFEVTGIQYTLEPVWENYDKAAQDYAIERYANVVKNMHIVLKAIK